MSGRGVAAIIMGRSGPRLTAIILPTGSHGLLTDAMTRGRRSSPLPALPLTVTACLSVCLTAMSRVSVTAVCPTTRFSTAAKTAYCLRALLSRCRGPFGSLTCITAPTV